MVLIYYDKTSDLYFPILFSEHPNCLFILDLVYLSPSHKVIEYTPSLDKKSII